MNTKTIANFLSIRSRCFTPLLASLCMIFGGLANAEDLAEAPVEPLAESMIQQKLEPGNVALSVEELKKKVIELNRDLFILEEDLLYPASTQFVVYVSVDTGEFLDLNVVKLKVDGEIVATHLYTERQVNALKRGGMQRLYRGNLKTGEHEIVAFVEGIGPQERPYKQAARLKIEKGAERSALELQIQDQSNDYQPKVSFKSWAN